MLPIFSFHCGWALWGLMRTFKMFLLNVNDHILTCLGACVDAYISKHLTNPYVDQPLLRVAHNLFFFIYNALQKLKVL